MLRLRGFLSDRTALRRQKSMPRQPTTRKEPDHDTMPDRRRRRLQEVPGVFVSPAEKPTLGDHKPEDKKPESSTSGGNKKLLTSRRHMTRVHAVRIM